MNRPINCWDDGGVRIIELNRPERLNALSHDMITTLCEMLSACDADDNVRAIVLQGKGKAFCAGDDLNEQMRVINSGPAAVSAQLETLQEVTRLLMFGKKPVVCAVQGWAVGAAFSWALNCDVSVWSEGSGAFSPELELGLFFTGGLTWTLPSLAGDTFAYDVLVLGRRVSAEELHAAGVANRVVPISGLHEQAQAIARQLAGLPTMLLRTMRKISIDAKREKIELALRVEAETCRAAQADTELVQRLKQKVASMRRK